MAGEATPVVLMSPRTRATWRVVQGVVWAVGMFIWGALIFAPKLGLHLLWNVLIPVAPALLVFAPGIWRNVCPLGTMSVMPRHLGLSKRKKLSPEWRGRLLMGALALLLVVVPLRHVLLDTNGPVLAAVLALVGLLAMGMGVAFEWKSGWCSSLCPVYPVEMLYGSEPAVTVPNAHCGPCARCVSPCADAKPGISPPASGENRLAKLSGLLLVGGFPGFVWGWYLVPTWTGTEGFSHLPEAYGVPYLGFVLSLGLYFALRRVVPEAHRSLLNRSFAAAAIILYYWFRLPPVFGFAENPAVAIVDLHTVLPGWTPVVLRILAIATFAWALVGRNSGRRAWEVRPPFAAAGRNAGSVKPASVGEAA